MKTILNPLNHMKYLLLLSLLFYSLSGQTHPSVDRQQQIIYLLRHDCGACHGMTLKGGLGPALLPANLVNKANSRLVNTILSGRPDTAMPGWRFLLNKDETQWLVKQLKQGIPNE